MKLLGLICLGFLAISCRGFTGEKKVIIASQTADAIVNSQKSLKVTSDTIPACTASNLNQLIYVADLQKLMSCDDSGWEEVAIKGADGKDGAPGADGKNGQAGLAIVSTKFITPTSPNLCTTNVECYLNAGQLLTLSDGTKILTAQGTYLNGNSNPPEADTTSNTYILTPGLNDYSYRFVLNARRGNVVANLLLVYVRNPEKVTIAFDSNINGFDANDEVVYTAPLANAPAAPVAP